MPAERTQKPDETRVPRPPNAWILFRSDMAKQIPRETVDEHGRVTRKTQAAVSKEISELWANANADTKRDYEQRADARKAEHSLKYPDYQFKPMKKEEKEQKRQEEKMAKEQAKANKKRGRTAPYTIPTAATSAVPASSLPPPPQPSRSVPLPQHFLYGMYGPTPPASAANSPEDSIVGGETSVEMHQDTSLRLPSATQTLASPSLGQDVLPPLSMPQLLPEQPIAGPSNWQESQASSSSWLGEPSQQSALSQDFITFGGFQQPWDGAHDPMTALLSGTGDPSVWQLGDFDPSILGQSDLELTFDDGVDPSTILDVPTMTREDVDNLLASIHANPNIPFDPSIFLQNHSLDPNAITSFSLHPDAPPQNYSPDDFINYEQASSSRSSSTTQESTPANPTPTPEERPQTSVPSTSTYTPPTGAAFSSQRRVAGSWPRHLQAESRKVSA